MEDGNNKIVNIAELTETQDAPQPQIQWGQLRKLMEFQELSFPALAKLSGTPESTLRKLLQGVTKDPRISTMLPVVKALGASFDRLLGLAPKRDFEHEAASYDVTLMDSMRHQVEALEQQNGANERELDHLRKLVLAKGEAHSRAEERVIAQEALVKERDASIARRDAIVAKYTQACADLNRKIEQQGERLEAKTQKIHDQAVEISALKAAIEARDQSISNLEAMHKRHGEEIKWQKIAIAALVGLLVLVVIYGAWEIINLDKGLTAWVENMPR